MSKYKRKYHRGERITDISELLEQRSVYLNMYDNRPKSVEVIKCMTLKTVLAFLNRGMVFKAIPGEGQDEVLVSAEPIEGQTNIFEDEENEKTE